MRFHDAQIVAPFWGAEAEELFELVLFKVSGRSVGSVGSVESEEQVEGGERKKKKK